MHRPPVRRAEFLQSLHKCEKMSARYQSMLEQTKSPFPFDLGLEEFDVNFATLNLSQAPYPAFQLSHDLRLRLWLRKCMPVFHAYLVGMDKDLLHIARESMSLSPDSSPRSGLNSPKCPCPDSTTKSLVEIYEKPSHSLFSEQSRINKLLPAIVLTRKCGSQEELSAKLGKLHENRPPRLEVDLASPGSTLSSRYSKFSKASWSVGPNHQSPHIKTLAISEHDGPLKTSCTPCYKTPPISSGKDLPPTYLRQSTETLASNYLRRTVGSTELREAAKRFAMDTGGSITENSGLKISKPPQGLTRRSKTLLNRRIRGPETDDEIVICSIQEAVSPHSVLIQSFQLTWCSVA